MGVDPESSLANELLMLGAVCAALMDNDQLRVDTPDTYEGTLSAYAWVTAPSFLKSRYRITVSMDVDPDAPVNDEPEADHDAISQMAFEVTEDNELEAGGA